MTALFYIYSYNNIIIISYMYIKYIYIAVGNILTMNAQNYTLKFIIFQRAQPYRSCSALFPSMEPSDNNLMAQANFNEGPIGGAIYFVSVLAI